MIMPYRGGSLSQRATLSSALVDCTPLTCSPATTTGLLPAVIVSFTDKTLYIYLDATLLSDDVRLRPASNSTPRTNMANVELVT